MREEDLYHPIRDWLAANGYEVRGEVAKCDIAARRDDELILIELKCRFGTELLVQAVERQKISESVYVAIPFPECGGHSPRWRGFKTLLRRLELGLIFCDPKQRPAVEIIFHPLPMERKRSKKKRTAVLTEMAGRSGDDHPGGTTRRKLVTAYREQALRIAALLEEQGPMSPKALRALGTGERTSSILYGNVYGWFDRIGRGLYALTPRGIDDLKTFAHVVARLRE